MSTILPDRPIDGPPEDLLNREPFAKVIADLIINAPPTGSLRIGVYGAWGQGKTSILRLVSHYVRQAGHVSVWLTPWVFSEREEILTYMMDQIAAELGIGILTLKSGREGHQSIKKFRKMAGSDIKLQIADILLGNQLEKYFEKKAEKMGQVFVSAVSNKLREKKLVVLVDDLDRVAPEMVPDLLLTLREALDFPNYFYVMALAPQVIEKGLSKVHEAWGEPHQFLEKIIELPMYIPDPSDSEIQKYAEALFQSAEINIGQQTITEVMPFLHKNPRKLKLFVRYLASLRGLFSRFDPNEIDWKGLCLCLMLRFEFPSQLQKLVQDDEVIKDIEIGYQKELMDIWVATQQPEEKARMEPAETRYAPNEEIDRQRFLQLYTALRQHGIPRGMYQLTELFRFADQPPALTFKEIGDKLQILKELPPGQRLQHLQEWLKTNSQPNLRKTQAFVDGLVNRRNLELESAADTKLEEDLKRHLEMASFITEILRIITIDLGGFRERILSSENWLAIFKHFAKWAHFRRLEYYENLREEERCLLRDSVEEMPLTLLEEASESADLNRLSLIGEHSEPFMELVEKIREKMEKRILDSLIEVFEKPHGVEAFWAISPQGVRRSLLFNDKGRFHSDRLVRKKLIEISKKAQYDDEVQINFLTYFQMLCHGAYGERGSFPREQCRNLLKDEELLKMIWDAAVARPLNPRIAGSLYRYRQSLIEDGIEEHLMATPSWWNRLGEIGFFNYGEEQRRSR